MNSVVFALLLATACIQVPNLFGIRLATNGELTWLIALKISLLTLPVTILASCSFSIFYGKGSNYLSYPALSILATFSALLVAILVQVFILNSRKTDVIEILGMSLGCVGLIIAFFHNEISSLIFK